MLNNIFITFLNMSISATLVAALLVLWRQISQRFIPAKFYYVLWGTILFRMTVPFSFKSNYSLLKIIQPSEKIVHGNHYMVTMEYIDIADVYGSTATQAVNWVDICSAVWIIGVVAMVIVWVAIFLHINRRLRYAVICTEDIVETVKKDFSVKKDIKVYKTSYKLSPMVLGFINPRIIFSEKSQADNMDFRYALAHEMVHIKRKDHAVKVIAYFALALHWFNPVIWLCFYMLNDDIEKSCDEAVIARYGVECKKDYATALISYADKRGGMQLGCISFAKKKVGQRVMNVLNYEKLPWKKITVFSVVTLAIGFSVTANPVLASEYSYVPKTVYLNSSQRAPFETLAAEFSQNIADKDINSIMQKSTADAEFFAPVYSVFAQDDMRLEVDNILYTSATTADVHYKMTGSKNLVFPQGTNHLVAQIKHSNVMGGLYIDNLHTYEDYNSFSLIDANQEAIQIVEKMIKFGITSGENTPENAKKIAAFCIDMAFDRAKDENLVFIPAQQVEDIADEFFLIKDFTNLQSTDYFDSADNVYMYDKNIGTRYEYKIINLEKTDNGATVTVHFYRDPLQTQLEKIIKYNLKKE